MEERKRHRSSRRRSRSPRKSDRSKRKSRSRSRSNSREKRRRERREKRGRKWDSEAPDVTSESVKAILPHLTNIAPVGMIATVDPSLNQSTTIIGNAGGKTSSMDAISATIASANAAIAQNNATVSGVITGGLMGGDAVTQAAMQANILSTNLGAVLPPSDDFAKRLYIGNLYYELTEADIRNHFQPFGIITVVDLSTEPGCQRSKGFCFLQFSDVLAAESAVQLLNGSSLGNRGIKVGRPHRGQGAAPMLGAAAGASTPSIGQQLVQKIPTKCIYIGGVRIELNSQHLESIFAPFGSVITCVMAPLSAQQPTVHRGYGFIEFADEASAMNAIENMNGFELAGQNLKVGKASPNAITVNVASSGDKSVHEPPPPPKIVEPEVSKKDEPSRCMILENMVQPDEVDNELSDEVRNECSKFGPIEKIHIYNDNKTTVKIFVVFEMSQGAQNAISSLHNRFFGGNTVSATHFPLDKFLLHDFN